MLQFMLVSGSSDYISANRCGPTEVWCCQAPGLPPPSVATSRLLQCTWCDHSQRCRSEKSYIWINLDNIDTQNKVKLIVCWISDMATHHGTIKDGWQKLTDVSEERRRKHSNNMSIKTIIQNALDKVGPRENSDKITFDAKCKLHTKWNINSSFINQEKGIE